MVWRIPRWVWTSMTLAAIVSAAALGYQQEHRGLRQVQERQLLRLTEALHDALQATQAYNRGTRSGPRISANGDTVEFLVPQPCQLLASAVQTERGRTILTVRPPSDAGQVWPDSLCQGPCLPLGKTGCVEVSGTSPVSLWGLERHRVYVDKSRGGLWLARGAQAATLVVPLIDRLSVEADPGDDGRSGYLLELSAVWQLDPQTAVRRKLYRYVSLERAASG